MRAPRLKWNKGGAAVALAAALALALAMPGPAEAGEDEAWDRERAFVEIERLQTEIGVLRALAGAQAALLAWNRVRTETLVPGTLVPGTLGPGGGAGPAVLAPHLCAEDTRAGEALRPWCRALPATFGADAATAADDAKGKDGE